MGGQLRRLCVYVIGRVVQSTRIENIMEIRSEEEIRSIIRERCAAQGQSAVAEELGLSQSVVSLILSGERGISPAVAEKFGFTKMTIFTPAESGAEGADTTSGTIASPGRPTH